MATRISEPALVDVEKLTELMLENPDIRLLDVRTPSEFSRGHIHGSYNAPLDELSGQVEKLKVACNSQTVLICRAGRRACMADETLKKSGFENLIVLDGGMDAWIQAGKPFVGKGGGLPLDRQTQIVAGLIALTGVVLALTVNPWYALISGFVACGLIMAGTTNFCPMMILLSKLPFNRKK